MTDPRRQKISEKFFAHSVQRFSLVNKEWQRCGSGILDSGYFATDKAHARGESRRGGYTGESKTGPLQKVEPKARQQEAGAATPAPVVRPGSLLLGLSANERTRPKRPEIVIRARTMESRRAVQP